MEMDGELCNICRLSYLLIDIGRYILRNIPLQQSHNSPLDEYIETGTKTVNDYQTETLASLLSSLEKQCKALDGNQCQVFQALFYALQDTLLSHAWRIEQHNSFLFLKEWDADIEQLRNTHQNQRSDLNECLCKIQNYTSLLKFIDKRSNAFSRQYNANKNDLMHLVRLYDEEITFTQTIGYDVYPLLTHEECQENIKESVNVFQQRLSVLNCSWHIQCHAPLTSWKKSISKDSYDKTLSNQVWDVQEDFSYTDCQEKIYDIYRTYYTKPDRKLAHVKDHLRNHQPLCKQWRIFRYPCRFTRKYLQVCQVYPSLSDQVIMGFFKSTREDLEPRIILTEQQWSLLYPVSSKSDLDSFDITLLCVLVRNVCSICSPEAGPLDDIADIDFSFQADISRPDRLRNHYVDYISNAFLPCTKFNQFWTTLELVLNRLSCRVSNGFQKDVKRTMVDTKTCSFDSLEEVKLQLHIISSDQSDAQTVENKKVLISLRLLQILDSNIWNSIIGTAIIKKDIIRRKMWPDIENLENEISATREGIVPCGKQEISSQSKVKLPFMIKMCIEDDELLQFRLAQETHQDEPKLEYVKPCLYNTNLSGFLCPSQLCLYNDQTIPPVLCKSISQRVQLQELKLDLDDYKLDLLGNSCLFKLYLYNRTIFSECAVPKGKSWSQFTKQQAFRQPHDLGDGKQYLSRASWPSELYVNYVTLVCMSVRYSLSLCTELNALKLSHANLGFDKLDLSGISCLAELYMKDVTLSSESPVLQSNCRSYILNGDFSLKCDYLKECWIQYCNKLQKIQLPHFNKVDGKLGLPDASFLSKLHLNDMTLYEVCNCLSHCAHLKKLTVSCANLRDGKLGLSATSPLSMRHSYSTLHWERICGAECQRNSCPSRTQKQCLNVFYLSHAEEQEQSGSAWFADNGRNIHVADTNFPSASPASTEDEMVRKIAQHVLIHEGSSKSNPSPTDVKPRLSVEKACYNTPITDTEEPSDFISLRCGNKPAKDLNVSFRVKDDLLDFLSLNSEMTKEQHLVKLREQVELPSSRRKSEICSLLKAFFTTVGKIFDARGNGGKTWQHILSESDIEISTEKEMFEVGLNERNVNDIDLQDKKKQYLQHLTKMPLEQLPQPFLNRDAIIWFVEGQIRHTLGGSSVSPAEHVELREIMNQLASDNIPGPHITMKYEMLRLYTMKSFPAGDRPFAIRIIGAGFYYAGNRDQVVCYCCGSRKDNWVLGDIPLFIHQTMFPSCSFLTNNATVNVPFRKTNSARSSAEVRLIGSQISNGSNQSDTTQGESSLILISNKQQQNNISSGNHQMLVTNKGSPTNQLMSSGGNNVFDNGQISSAHMCSMEDPPPMYPQFSSKNTRISSFQGWPAELRHRPDEMAECGFYYAGFGDCVRCFYCGVGLRQWINEDDPWIEHARWSTSCAYVRKMKGDEFVFLVKMAVEIAEREEASQNDSGGNQPSQHNTEAALADTVTEDSHNSNSTNSTAPRDCTSSTGATGGAAGGVAASISSRGNSEMQKYLLTDAAQSVLDMGYQPKLVLRAIEKVLMKKGTEELTGQMIMEAVFEIEEDKGISKLQPSSQSAQENKSNAKAAESATTEELLIDPEQIMREHRELREATLCKICLDKTISVVFLPCGHLVTCPDCAPAMRKCPVCRSLIKGTVKTFFG